MLETVKRLLLASSFLAPVGADIEDSGNNSYCFDVNSPEGILLARQQLEAVEAPGAKIHTHSEIDLVNGRVVRNNISLRLNNNSHANVKINQEGCLELSMPPLND